MFKFIVKLLETFYNFFVMYFPTWNVKVFKV